MQATDFAVVLCGMDGSAWNHYRGAFSGRDWSRPWSRRDTAGEEIHAYLEQAGGSGSQRTHGRRSVAGLNQMDNCLWKIRPW